MLVISSFIRLVCLSSLGNFNDFIRSFGPIFFEDEINRFSTGIGNRQVNYSVLAFNNLFLEYSKAVLRRNKSYSIYVWPTTMGRYIILEQAHIIP